MSVLNNIAGFFNSPKETPTPLNKKDLANSLMERIVNLKSMNKKAQINFVNDLFTLSKLVEREEISDWQNARSMALRGSGGYPQTYKLMEIYRRTMLDLHLLGAVRNRRSRFLNKKIVIKESDGTVNDEKTALLNKSWFRKYLRFEYETLFFGYGVAWFGKEGNKKGFEFTDFDILPRQNVNPFTQSILNRPYDIHGIRVDDERVADWNIFSCLADEGTEEHLGLLNNLAPMKILKWHSWASWDIREEKFGQPMIVAKTIMNDDATMQKIFDWLMTLTTDNVAVLPSMAGEFQIIEPSSTDVYKMFMEKINLVNSEMSKGVEGATSTMDQGKKFQVSDVHERTGASITADDMILLGQKVKDVLIPFLIKHGYPFSGTEDFDFVSSETLTKEKKLETVEKFSQLGYRFNTDELQKLIGVEIESEPASAPAPEPIEPEPAPPEDNEPKEGEPTAKKPKPFTPKQLRERRMEALNKADRVHWTEQLEAIYEQSCAKCANSLKIVNEGEKDIEEEEFIRIWDGLATRLHNGDELIMDEELWLETSNWLSRALAEGFELADNLPSAELITALNENVAIFSAFKTYQQLRQATDLLLDADGKLKGFSAFKADILALNETYNTFYLRAEYVNAISTAQSAAQWERFELDADTFDLQYQTSGDERVRKEHERLDGIVRPVADEVWDSIMPPNGWRCRCDVSQVEGEELTDSDFANTEAEKAHRNEIFKFNPGKSKQAFPDKHPYYNIQNQTDLDEVEKFIDDNV